MEIIGVIDLRRGAAVHAVAGQRERYAPVGSAADEVVAGDAAALARVYITRLGVSELYVADLDAIVERRPQDDAIRRLVATGAPVWLDAGVASGGDASRAVEAGAAHVVVGTETLASWSDLLTILRVHGAGRIALSLDLRDGHPQGPVAGAGLSASDVASRARDAGASTVIVIDVARVGTRGGLDVDLLAGIRDAVPGVRLVAGGGVRGEDDLQRLATLGYDAALVATALHDGRLDAAAVAAARVGYRSVSR